MKPGTPVRVRATVFVDPEAAPVVLVQFRGADGHPGPPVPVAREDVEAVPREPPPSAG